MFSALTCLVIAGIALVVGAIVGGLIVRNNYRTFRNDEAEFKRWLAEPNMDPKAVVLRIRNKLKI